MVWKGNLAIFESSNISKTKEATPTKIGVHAPDINLYLHEFFALILFFDPHELYSPKFWPFLKASKRSHNSETGGRAH